MRHFWLLELTLTKPHGVTVIGKWFRVSDPGGRICGARCRETRHEAAATEPMMGIASLGPSCGSI
jgi:hypothetical protein